MQRLTYDLATEIFGDTEDMTFEEACLDDAFAQIVKLVTAAYNKGHESALADDEARLI